MLGVAEGSSVRERACSRTKIISGVGGRSRSSRDVVITVGVADAVGVVAAVSERMDFPSASTDCCFTLPIKLRAAQAAPTNVRKHAQAGSATLLLDEMRGGVRIRVVDDGWGFDLSTGTGAPGHLGLTAMPERAAVAGGRLSVRARQAKARDGRGVGTNAGWHVAPPAGLAPRGAGSLARSGGRRTMRRPAVPAAGRRPRWRSNPCAATAGPAFVRSPATFGSRPRANSGRGADRAARSCMDSRG